MDNILAFLGNFMVTTWFVIFMFIVAVITDYSQSKRDDFGWSVFFTLIAATCGWLLVKPSVTMVIAAAILWIPLGICWAFCKWKLRIDKAQYTIRTEQLTPGDAEYERLKRSLDIDKVKGTVAHWILFFPVSILSTLLFNVFDFVEYLITVRLGGAFKRMAAKPFE